MMIFDNNFLVGMIACWVCVENMSRGWTWQEIEIHESTPLYMQSIDRALQSSIYC